MKRKILLLASLCITGIASAQEQNGVGIGVPLPDASAILHVESTNRGLLIPNVVLTDINSKSPIAADAKESLLVYNKKGGALAAGYYYWVATDATTGKWVRVITSEDAGAILDGQVQEYFKEVKEERDMPKVDPATGKVVRDADGNVVMEKREVGGKYVYVADKTKVDDPAYLDRLTIDIPSLVKEQETITTFGVSQFKLHHHLDGTKTRDGVGEPNNPVIKTSTELELVYTDERGEINKYAVRDLLGADQVDVEAITNLQLNAGKTALIYTNDKGKDITVPMNEVVSNLQSLTTLSLDASNQLVYLDEHGRTTSIALRPIVKEPWYVAEDGTEAVKNDQNIFVNGWVGVGLSAVDAATAVTQLKPDEKLRVNGSIYARNSYYADYVFENYFTKEASSLKYDYKFNDLATVESFIKTYRHLPGITPVSELDKSADEGYLVNVSELSIQLLEKVEELYLHTIDQNKLIQQQAEQLEQQEMRLKQLEALMNQNK